MPEWFTDQGDYSEYHDRMREEDRDRKTKFVGTILLVVVVILILLCCNFFWPWTPVTAPVITPTN
jgi:hypothetical protein